MVPNGRSRSRIDEKDTRSPILRSKWPEKGFKGPFWADSVFEKNRVFGLKWGTEVMGSDSGVVPYRSVSKFDSDFLFVLGSGLTPARTLGMRARAGRP